jgi:hypothetical protein
MSDPSDFADAARAWLELIAAAARLPLTVRAEAFAAHLVHLYAAGLRLPVAAAAPDRVDAFAWPEDWPGFAALEAGTPDTTALLRGVSSDLATGLWWFERDPDAGAAWWRATFDARWGTLAVAALPRLHLGVVAGRRAVGGPPAEGGSATADPAAREPAAAGPDAGQPGARSAPTEHPDLPASSPSGGSAPRAPGEPATTPAGGGMLLSFEPAKPERRPTGRARAPIGEQGVLGVRCEPERDGLRVQAVHPAGPAAGQLAPGDLLMQVDGVSLAGLDHATAPAALAGSIGVARRVRARRGDDDLHLALTPVAPGALSAGPSRVPLLVLDRDAAAATLAVLMQIGVSVTASEDQEGLVELVIPPGAGGAVLASLRDGEDQGLWEILEGP